MIDYEDNEQTLLSFYGLKTLHPTKLEDIQVAVDEPIDIDKISSMEKEEQYDLLNKFVKDSTSGSELTYNYFDEELEDPLRGNGTNVIRDLLQLRVISSQNDPSINEYLISSREFNSKKFLTTVHKDTSIDQLISYLDFLKANIEGQQGRLKETIDENYINFVNCKDSIDEVLKVFKKLKTRAQQEMDKIRIYNPSKDKARLRSQSYLSDNKFLLGELEDAIKNLTLLTSTMIRPIKENKLKETKISKLIDFVTKHKFLFDLPSKLINSVKLANHDEIIENLQVYTKLKQKLIEEENAKILQIKSQINDRNKSDDSNDNSDHTSEVIQEYQSINTLLIKIFNEIDKIIDEYRKSTYNELLNFDHEISSNTLKLNRSSNTKFLSLVDKIDQLNGDSKHLESPINAFLRALLKKSNKDLTYQFEKFEVKFNNMQKKSLDYIKSLEDHRPNGSYIKYIADKYRDLEEYFKTSTSIKSPNFEEKESIVLEIFDSSENLDLSLINETWLVFLNFINYLSDVYLKDINKFVNNYKYYKVHNKNVDEKGEIKEEFTKVIVDISNKLFNLFNGNEDTTSNQLESTPLNYSNILPYYANSLSTIYYITRISDKINVILSNFGKNITVVNNISVSGKSNDVNKIIKNLRNISNSIIQKVLEASCAVWVNDCSQFYELETWDIDEKLFRFNDQQELSIMGLENGDEVNYSNTKLVNIIEFYSIFILRKLKNLVFINLDTTSEDYVKIVTTYPNKKMLVSIEIQFMRCLSILVDSIMKKYNLELQQDAGDERSKDLSNTGDGNKIFKVLTMNNFDKISRVIYPNLIKNYDMKFDKDLSNQNLKLFSDIDKASLTILDDILSKEKYVLDEVLNKFFNKLNQKSMQRSEEIKIDNFIYEVLIHFVKIVYNIKPITNKEIFVNIINELQNFFLKNFLDYFRKLKVIEHFAYQLVNLKLDINFFIEIFEPSKTLKLNEYSFNVAEIILGAIMEKEDKKVISDKDFDKILIKGLKDSASQFDCLSR